MSRGPAVLVPGPLLINNETELVDKVFCKQLHPKRVIPLSLSKVAKMQMSEFGLALGLGTGVFTLLSSQSAREQRKSFALPSFLPSPLVPFLRLHIRMRWRADADGH